MSKKKVLGRGLNALLTDSLDRSQSSDMVGIPPSEKTLSTILLTEIEANPHQPRQHFEPDSIRELAKSIQQHGIIQPITVRRLAPQRYQLISGERRYKASQEAGLKSIPVYVRSADDQVMLEMSLIENIQREDLNPIEIAVSYQRLIFECHFKPEELGTRVGKNRSTVTNYLRLLKLPPDIQIALRDKKVSMGHARSIINIENPDVQLDLFKKIISDNLSVRQVEELTRQSDSKTKKKPESSKKLSSELKEIKKLQSTLSSHFSTKINIRSNGEKGEIRIPFISIEDLNRILDILKL